MVNQKSDDSEYDEPEIEEDYDREDLSERAT
jgi:hypothetical protein